MSFLAELKRRNVIRMAGLYLVGAWLLTQVASTVLPMFDAPAWLPRSIVILLAVGFIPALVFSWVFELTPHGIKRDAEVSPQESIAPQTARRMDRLIITVLALALVYFGFDKFVLAPQREAAQFAQTKQSVVQPAAQSINSKSIAVLPFVNMSGEANNDYFSDGITEEILNALAQIPDLKVAARTSAFAFKGKHEDLRKVGDMLGVATVLEGSVQRAGDEVRITAQLIDARNGYHLWSEKYDRQLTNIFAVEDEISTAIADKLQVQLSGADRNSQEATKTVDPRAHDFYLRGLKLYAARGVGMRDAAIAFEQATAIDPRYAQAWAALAQTEVQLHNWKFDVDGMGMTRAQSAVDHALAIDPDLASAQVAQGMLHRSRWQWSAAEKALQRAMELAPGDAEVSDQYAQFLFSTRQLESALREIERANRLDPLSGVIGGTHALILLSLHRGDAASEQIARTLVVAPDEIYAQGVAGAVAIYSKRYPEAEQHVRRVASLHGRDADQAAIMVQGLANPALRARAIEAADSALPKSFQKVYWLALLADRNTALTALEATIADGPISAEEWLWLPAFDPIRDDPRFKAVLKKMGLPYPPPAGVSK
jgi:TolB-like protein/Tfp pilus assembly protein PilF